MTSLSALRELVTTIAPWSYLMFGATLAAIIAAIIAVRRANHDPSQSLVFAFAPSGIALVLLVLAGLTVVENARGLFLQIVAHPPDDPSMIAVNLADSISQQFNGLACLDVCALPAIAIVGACVACAAYRRKSWIVFVLSIGMTLLLFLTARANTYYALTIIHSFAAIAGVEPDMKVKLIFEALAEAGAAQALAKWLVIAMGVMATAAAAIAAGRTAAQAPSTNVLIASAIVLLVGAGAFAITRGEAADGAHPLRIVNASGAAVPDQKGLPHATATGACIQVTAQPIVRGRRSGFALDGRSLQTVDDLNDQLMTLKNNYRLLHPDDDRPIEPLFAIDEDVPVASVAPWLKTIARAGFTTVGYVTEHDEIDETKTMGPLKRPSSCVAKLALSDDGKRLSSFARWGDLQAELTHPDVPFPITP